MLPAFTDHQRIILFDLAGALNSDVSAYDRSRYATLEGLAEDIPEITYV